MKRQEKEGLVTYLQRRFEESDVMILTDCRGLNVESITELRRVLREQGAEFKVVKNTLAKIAARNTTMAAAEAAFQGPTAVVLHESEASQLARVLADFARKNDEFKIKAGVVSGKFYNAGQIESIARLPGREYLLAMMAGAFQSGPSRLLGVISAMPQKMAGLLLALKELRGKAN